MSDRVKLPGRPAIALDIASARRWIDRVLKKVDMGEVEAASLHAAVKTLRSLESVALK